jgi:hypothetical protein
MTARTVIINPIEPALLSIRAALGVPLDLDLTFLSQAKTPVDPTPLKPQLALLPRSRLGVYPYEVTITGPANGFGNVKVPGTALVDPNGYNLELYQRRTADNPADPPVAVGLLAKGVLRLEGSAYASTGPLSMINIPVVVGPPGPQGIQGQQGVQGDPGQTGQRGSVWTTGTGDPTATDALPGDMYLDEFNGNVWRFDGATWVLGTF